MTVRPSSTGLSFAKSEIWALRAEARGGLQGKRIGDGQVRPHLYAGARLVSANELPKAFGHDRLIGVDAAPGVKAACLLARELAIVMIGDGQHDGACLRIACLLGGFRELTGDGGLAVRQVDRGNVHLVGTGAFCRPSASRISGQYRDMDAAGMRRKHTAPRLHARQRALERAFKQGLLKGIERLCAHMVQLRKADSHTLIHVDIEVHQGKRSLS